MRTIDRYELTCGTSCAISPDWGCNLFSWKVGGVELMFCPEDYPAAAWKITGGGNPILFPSVGRTWDFSTGEPVQGIYRIHPSDKNWFMPSHGILYDCKFTKIDESIEDDRISVAYELQISDKVKVDNYPFDMAFTQRFTLTPDSIELEATITNNDDKPAPAAFGYHPYFRISNPQREGVEVCLPVTRYLKTTPDTVLLTGESEDADGVIDLQPDVYYDHTFTGATGTRMSLIDQRAGHTINVDYDDKFELFLVYSPDGSEFVCIEPWTRGLGAYMNLIEPDWPLGKHIPVLQPGETTSYKATFWSVTMIKAVIFDMDGVLVDSEEYICEAAMRMFAERGLTVKPEDFLSFVGAGENRYIGGVAEKYEFPLDLDRDKRRTYEIYAEIVKGKLEPLIGAREFIAKARDKGLKLAVASSADKTKVEINLREIGFSVDSFDTVVNGLDVTHKKPDPEIFLNAAERLGVSPSECLVVEDAVNGVAAAKSAGMRCLGLTTSFSPEELSDADWTAPNLAEASDEVLDW